MNHERIASTKVRRHNGQSAYGQWEPLSQQFDEVIEAIAAEILEPAGRQPGNTESAGKLSIAGECWVYRN